MAIRLRIAGSGLCGDCAAGATEVRQVHPGSSADVEYLAGQVGE